MALDFLKSKKKPSTLEEVRKAYEDLSDDDKKSFHQSIADRIHESVAAQEREHGQEDSQSAEAREHEALGEEHADGKGDTEELHESDDTAEERAEDRRRDEREDRISALEMRLNELYDRFDKRDESREKLEAKREKYGLSSSATPETRKEVYDERKINNLLGK